MIQTCDDLLKPSVRSFLESTPKKKISGQIKQKNLDGEHNPIKSSHFGKRANHDEAARPDVVVRVIKALRERHTIAILAAVFNCMTRLPVFEKLRTPAR